MYETHIANLNPFRYRSYFYDAETGFYWLNTRYYDPAIGRFINADNIVTGTSGDIKGYNQYAYCFNNPINMDDADGNWPQFIKKAVKWVADKVVKPVVKKIEETISKVDLTYSTGYSVSATPGAFSFTAQGGISVDTKGNVAIQGSFAGGVTTSDASASFSRYETITNAPSVEKLNGPSYQLGASVGVPIGGAAASVGREVSLIPDQESSAYYYGLSKNIGISTSASIDAHLEWGETATWEAAQFNIFDVAENIYIKIMEW